jgi:hypothetical protein
MSEPDKNDFDRNLLPPSAVPDNKVLHPIFGTHCRTETFSTVNAEKKTSHIHCEAYMDDPVAKTWTVTKVVRVMEQKSFNPYKQKTITHVHHLKSKVSFKEAVKELADFESKCKEKPAHYSPSYPDAPAMGFSHFKAFAEREGYVFDAKGTPHARPAADALPPGFSFAEDDIASSAKNLQRPAEEFDNSGPASKVPNAHFLLDHFTRAAHGDDYTASTNALRVLNLLDRFVEQVDTAHGKLKEYCGKYHELGHGGLIYDAEDLLAKAESSVRQMKAYGVDTEKFENFVLQCKISCYVLHAEGLYALMSEGKGDFDANEKLFKARVNQALEAYKKVDSSEEGMKTLQNMIVQTPEPTVPSAIGHFIDRYKKVRKDFDHAKPGEKPAAGGKPKSPKP